MDKCILGDTLLQHVTESIQSLSQKTGQPSPTKNIAFVSEKEMKKRLELALQTPKYAKIDITGIVTYISSGRTLLRQALYKTANKCNAH